MSETYIVTAKTVEEAMALANTKYGGADKEISFDILEMPKKGFLGIGAKEAKIQVTVSEAEDISLGSIVAEMKSYKLQTAKYDIDEDKPAKPAQKPEHKPENKPAPKAEPKPENKPAPKAEPKPENKPAPKAEPKPENKPAPKAEPKPENKPAPKAEPKPENKPAPKAEPKPENKPAPKAEPKPENKPAPKAEPKPEKDDIAGEDEIPAAVVEKTQKCGVTREEMDCALEFTNTLLANMKLGATAQALPCPEGEEYEKNGDADVYPAIEITGDGTGILIGHHGETLDAIQYLLNLSSVRRSGHAGGDYVKISLDIENYRSKREETLRALARRMAQRALKYKRNVFLEPMNAYERRIIHSELQNVENISTHSVGTDKNRKIIITYEGADKAAADKNRRRGKGGKPENGASVDASMNETMARPEAEDDKPAEEPKSNGNGNGGNRSRNRHRNRHRSDRPSEGERKPADDSASGNTGGNSTGYGSKPKPERPRPPKPQKLPIEALPDFLASAEDEPVEHLREN